MSLCFDYGMLDYGGKEKNWRPDGNCLDPSVSIEDRTVVGPADHV